MKKIHMKFYGIAHKKRLPIRGVLFKIIALSGSGSNGWVGNKGIRSDKSHSHYCHYNYNTNYGNEHIKRMKFSSPATLKIINVSHITFPLAESAVQYRFDLLP
jgi:hypothetical protein